MHVVPTFEKGAGTAMPTELLGLRRARLPALCESFPSFLFHVLLLIHKCSAAAALVPSDGQLICPPYKISEQESTTALAWSLLGPAAGGIRAALEDTLLPNCIQHGLIFVTVKWAYRCSLFFCGIMGGLLVKSNYQSKSLASWRAQGKLFCSGLAAPVSLPLKAGRKHACFLQS